MEISKEDLMQKVDELAAEYDLNKRTILGYYNNLCTYECYEDSQAFDCLELVCQRRVSANIKIQNDNPYSESVNYSIEYALYETYQDKAVPYLTNNYLCRVKGLK